LKQVLYPNGVNETLSWNSDNTLSQISHKNGATVIEQSQYSYDGLGRRKTNLETLSGTALTYTYQYDPLDRLVSAANGAATQQESYGYDSQNNRVQKQIGNPVAATYAYQYDAAQQLTETHQTSLTGAMLEAYLYDNAGNQSQKCTGGTVTRVSNTACTGSTVQGYVYNSFNKMTQINGATTASYRYDDQGRRVQKIEGANAVNYLYDGNNIYSEYPVGSWASPNAAYVQAGTDHPMARLTGNVGDPSATAAYYHQDGLGSVLAATNAAKAVTASQRFGAFGATIAQTGTILQYGYTGREPDASGMIYYRARYYDANGRFTQRDPLGYADGINRYAYVHNNPINFNDPNGLLASQVGTWLNTQTTSYVSNLGNAAVNTFGDPSTWPAQGAAYGGAAGGIVGALSGGAGGGFGGTLVAPGVGTIGGAYTGSLAGAIQGVGIGATAGAVIGATAADLYYQTQINQGQQDKHIPDTNNYIPGRSTLTDPNPQGLLDKFGGTGTPVNNVTPGSAGFKERVDFSKVIGNYVDPVTGSSTPTTNGIIHYGNNGAHIVPSRP
jgi:RHS repeat-associated protein